MAKHHRIGPSGADIWMPCAGSVKAQEAVGPKPSNIYAAEGAALHRVAAWCLRLGFEPYDFIGQVFEIDGFRIEIDFEMADCMVDGLDVIRTEEQTFDLYVEERVDTSRWIGAGAFGTLDVGLVHPSRPICIVRDWKFGKGVAVSSENNKQMRIYALGFWDTVIRPEYGYALEDVRFTLGIEQPRIEGATSEWDVSGAKLRGFGDEIRDQIELINSPNPPLVAGPHCTFCAAKATCGAHEKFMMDSLNVKFSDIDGALDDAESLERIRWPAKVKMTAEQRSALILCASQISNWLSDLKSSAADDYFKGKPTPFLKMVSGRSKPRKYKEGAEAKVARLLRAFLDEDQIYSPPKIASPAVVQKLLGKKAFEDVVDRYVAPQEDGAPVLVPETSKKKGLPKISEKFATVGETDDDAP